MMKRKTSSNLKEALARGALSGFASDDKGIEKLHEAAIWILGCQEFIQC